MIVFKWDKFRINQRWTGVNPQVLFACHSLWALIGAEFVPGLWESAPSKLSVLSRLHPEKPEQLLSSWVIHACGQGGIHEHTRLCPHTHTCPALQGTEKSVPLFFLLHPMQSSEPWAKPKAKYVPRNSALYFFGFPWYFQAGGRTEITTPQCWFCVQRCRAVLKSSGQQMGCRNICQSPPDKEKTWRAAAVVGWMLWGDHWKIFIKRFPQNWGF